VEEKQTIHQHKKNKLSTSEGKTNYQAAQEKQTIHQSRRYKLSTSGKIQTFFV
jgi:hypothetical protein